MPALQQLDVDLAIGSTEQGDAVKSTAYLETVIFELQQHILDLENIDAIEVTGDYSQLDSDDVIFCDGDLTVTLIDAALANRTVTIRNISGTTTIAASVGTTESTSLSVGTSVTLAPRASGWFII